MRIDFSFVWLLASCGDDSVQGMDAGSDVETPMDGDSDVRADAGNDTGKDVGSDAGPLPDYPAQVLPTSRAVGDGRIETVEVDVPAPPSNPTTGAETPNALSATSSLQQRRTALSLRCLDS